MGFSRQEYWGGLPFPPPGDLPNPGIKPRSPMLQAVSLPSEPPGTGYISNLVSPPLPTCASGARHYRTHSYQQKTSDPALWCHKVSWICLVGIRKISGSHAHPGPEFSERQSDLLRSGLIWRDTHSIDRMQSVSKGRTTLGETHSIDRVWAISKG